MEFLRSLLRRLFARAQVATSRNVGCFLRLAFIRMFTLLKQTDVVVSMTLHGTVNRCNCQTLEKDRYTINNIINYISR